MSELNNCASARALIEADCAHPARGRHRRPELKPLGSRSRILQDSVILSGENLYGPRVIIAQPQFTYKDSLFNLLN